MADPDDTWLSQLLGEEQQPLDSMLDLDTLPPVPLGAEGLFEPSSLAAGLPELCLDAALDPAAGTGGWPQHSSESTRADSQDASNTAAGMAQPGASSQATGAPPGRSGAAAAGSPTTSQTTPQGSAHVAQGGSASPGRTSAASSQQHSGTAAPNATDSCGQSALRVGAAAAAPGPHPPPQLYEPHLQELSEGELKRQARLARNRENAQLSRQRKKAAVQGLEQRCSELQAHNAQLGGLVSRLTAEVAALRFQLAAVCQQAGRPVPHVPSALPPSLAAAAASSAVPTVAALPPPVTPALAAAAAVAAQQQLAAQLAAQQGRLPVPAAGTAPVAFPPGATAPKVAIPAYKPAVPRLQPAAAGAAAGAAKAKQPPQGGADAGGRKRTRTAAGSAFLALFTLFMFVGPFGPGLPGSGLVSPGATGPELPALPAGAGVAVERPRAGRALLQLAGTGDGGGPPGMPLAMPALPALPAAPSDAAAGRSARTTALAVADESAGSLEAAGKAGGSGQLAALWNATKTSLWPARQALSAAQLEGLALQRLQELGPVSLLLDADDPLATPAHPLAASQAFPQLAGQLFGSSGLLPPQTCSPVFELDAASLPSAERSRRSIERLLLGTLGMRGRSVPVPGGAGRAAEKAAALPAGARLVGEWDVEDGGGEEWQDVDSVQQQDEGGARRGPLMKSPATGQPSEVAPPASEEAPVLVSILVPAANVSGGGGEAGGSDGEAGGLLASVRKVFVVLLHPRQRYVAYACALQPSLL